MNKELKKINAMLAEKEKQREEIQANAATNTKELMEAKAALTGMLDSAETPEEYKKLLADLRDTEATIEFCKKKQMQADNAKYLTPAEYKEIKNKLQEIFAETQGEYKQKLDAKIDELIALKKSLEDETDKLNFLLIKANELSGSNAVTFKAMSFFAPAFDPFNYHNPFYKAFGEMNNLEQLHLVGAPGGKK